MKIHTLFAQKSPQALQSDLGPDGPLRIIGVDFELIPQCVHLYIHNHAIQRDGKTSIGISQPKLHHQKPTISHQIILG